MFQFLTEDLANLSLISR